MSMLNYTKPAQFSLKKSEQPIDQHKFVGGCNSYFISLWRFHWVWKKFWYDSELSEVKLTQNFLQLKKLSQAAGITLVGHMQPVCCPGLVYSIDSAYPKNTNLSMNHSFLWTCCNHTNQNLVRSYTTVFSISWIFIMCKKFGQIYVV